MLAYRAQDVVHPRAGLLLTYEPPAPQDPAAIEDVLIHEGHVVHDMELGLKPSCPATSTCAICLEPVPAPQENPPADAAGEAVPTQPTSFSLSCTHQFCFGCIKSYVAQKVDERQVEPDQLICPILECRCSIIVENILHITTEATFLKYMRFVQRNQFERMPHGRWCPSPTCDAMVECNPKQATFTCTTCKTRGCFKCGSHSHPYRTCHQAMDAQYREWEARQSATSNAVKPCPGCGFRIWKNEGCDHMTCTKCRHEWCWKCRFRWGNHNRQLCQAIVALDSPYWGPIWPVRFLTKTIAIPLVVAGGVVGGATFAAWCVLVGLPQLLFKGLQWSVRQIRRCIRQRNQARRGPIVPLSSFAQQIQHGVHVYIHQDPTDDATPGDNAWLRDLTRGGRWRNGNDQYVQYAQPATGANGFVSYLSSHTTRVPTLEDTPHSIALVVLHRTMGLPAPAVLRAILQPQTAKVILVVDAPADIEATDEMAETLATLRQFHRHGIVLTVQNEHPTGALDAASLSAIYVALFRLHGEQWRP